MTTNTAEPALPESVGAEWAPLGVALAWTVHPARQSIAKSATAVIATSATGLLIGLCADSVVVGLLSAALLVLSLRRFFFPTHTCVDEEGIVVRCLGLETRRSWTRLRRFRYDDAGAFLSTRGRPSVLDAWTGLHLSWGNNRDQAVAFIARQMSSTAS